MVVTCLGLGYSVGGFKRLYYATGDGYGRCSGVTKRFMRAGAWGNSFLAYMFQGSREGYACDLG